MALGWWRLRSIPVAGGETGGGGGSGRMPAGWTLELRRWETHQGLASMTARSGGSKPAVVGGTSHRGAWLVGRRAAQPQCPARGGEGEVGGEPEWPARSRVPGSRRRRRPLVAALRGGGACSSAWLVEANTRAAGGASGWFTLVASGNGEQRNDVGGRVRAHEMAMVLAI
jgi:hypothetical protein